MDSLSALMRHDYYRSFGFDSERAAGWGVDGLNMFFSCIFSLFWPVPGAQSRIRSLSHLVRAFFPQIRLKIYDPMSKPNGIDTSRVHLSVHTLARYFCSDSVYRGLGLTQWFPSFGELIWPLR